jgi:hypothetical protein
LAVLVTQVAAVARLAPHLLPHQLLLRLHPLLVMMTKRRVTMLAATLIRTPALLALVGPVTAPLLGEWASRKATLLVGLVEVAQATSQALRGHWHQVLMFQWGGARGRSGDMHK